MHMAIHNHFLPLAALALICQYMVNCSGSGNYPDGDSRYESFAPDGIPFKVADSQWKVDMRGHHRAVVKVEDGTAEGVVAQLPWRRPDLRIDTKKIVVTDSEDQEISDVAVTEMTSERGEVVFRPSSGAGVYYIYYLPYYWRSKYGDARYGIPWNDYLAPEYDADSSWRENVVRDKDELPEAKVECFESVSRFNFWSPMGLIATQEEIDAVKAEAGREMIIFPEDRAFPIQLTYQIPVRWRTAPKQEFHGLAQRNEYYTWQLGVWAAEKELKDVKVSFSELRNGYATIGSDAMTCFNQEGTNWDGKPLEFVVNVPEGKVQALWCGMDIPEDAKPGTYKGQATVSADGVEPQTIELAIKVSSKVLTNKGDSEPWRHSRLSWLNSTIALDDEPVAPYKEMTLDGNVIEATGRKVTVGRNGLIQKVEINEHEILERPQQIIVSTAKGDIPFTADNLEIKKESAGLVKWTASSEVQGLRFVMDGNMEFDGHMHFDINVSSGEEIEVRDVKLVTTYSEYSSEYFMGVGYAGGYRPASHIYSWDGPYDSYWIGGVKAGMHTEFRGGTYHGPLIADYKPEPTPVWSNRGLGRVSVTGAKGKPATVTASTGKRTIGREPVNYEFNLLITPLKDLDPSRHFSERYFHSDPADFDRAAADGANVSNIHHARKLNPFINYPYIVRDSLIAHIRHQHENGRKVKLYYTIRELTTHCEEVYAFHSLNHEIFLEGPGYGLPWECEHLVDDYKPAWYTPLDDIRDGTLIKEGDSDAALVLTPNSRFINYFLEGLRWMEENYDLDGIYMDDVSFDRTTVKRIRKILDRYHEGALVDLHSNTAYSRGPANQYTEFFPYVNRLWFGESFRYDEMTPDQWLVTFSGIPFGLMAEMLQGGGNRFLGMVYGATARHSWTDAGNLKSPVPVWKFWDTFGIRDARMLGYWDPDCPVKTSDPEVKATAYVKDGATLVSVGNFSDRDKMVSLDIDWKGLGIDPSKARIIAPAIENFQEETIFRLNERIPVKSKEGWLIILDNNK